MPYAKAGDLNVYYIERGAGIPVIFVHGNWGTSSWWEPTLARLPASYHGIAYDMRGRGKTEGPDNDYTMPQMAADLAAFSDALGIEKAHIVGHSLGTAVAMEYTLEHPERVLTLTVVAPAWVDGMPAILNNADGQRALKANKALFGMGLKALAPGAPDDDFWKRLVDEGFEQRLEAALSNLPALVDWHPGDKLKETGVPSLVIVGSADPLTGATAERAARALGARYVLLEGVGHSPNVEVPDRFVELLLEQFDQAR